ncbi:calcium-binding protein [Lutimaribacter marinistellae]|uniref:Calcium-binding protein n=1 Tax=Lutimaribacter marinistellae TaxID=1820329 RepID=A0ABV7TCU2_9RHOB
MRVSGELILPEDCTAVEWLIEFFNSITARVAEGLGSGRPSDGGVDRLIILDGTIDGWSLPETSGQPDSRAVSLNGTGIDFAGGVTPQGFGTITSISITATVDGRPQARLIEFPEPVSLDAILGETARNLDTTSKRIEDNPGFAQLVLPDRFFFDERGTAGNDLIKGFDTDDFLNGAAGHDTILGRIGNDDLIGDAGDDLLNGGPGQDTQDGGPGRDTLIGTLDEFNLDVIRGLSTEDELHFVGFGNLFTGPDQFEVRDESVLIISEGEEVQILLTGIDDDTPFSADRSGDDVVFRLLDPAVNLPGGVGPDLLEGAGNNDTLIGGPGDDTLIGFDGDDRLLGEGDNDDLRGGDGNDTLNGGDGDDTILGGDTEDDLRDVIFGGAGNDQIDGGHGNDQIFGQEGNDTLSGGFGADELQGQEGDDGITGGALSDLVFGGAGNDFVNGGFGYDRINGGDGADRIFHLGVFDHGSDWVQDYNAVEGDVLVFGQMATFDDFQINLAHTATPDGERSGADDVQEAFIILRATGQIIWALVDGEGQSSINVQAGGEIFDLMG